MSAVKTLLPFLVLGLLAGCGSLPLHENDTPVTDSQPLASPEQAKDAVHLQLIRDMLKRGQYYAAIAHIQQVQQSSGQSPSLTLMEADARRNLGQLDAADQLYRSLLGGALDGRAERGVGLIYAARGDLKDAVDALGKAASELPTDSRVRNDYGYALTQSGQYQKAFTELSTAAELDPTDLRPRKNLIVLMLLMDRPTAAQELAHRSGLGSNQMAALRKQASAIRAQQASSNTQSAG